MFHPNITIACTSHRLTLVRTIRKQYYRFKFYVVVCAVFANKFESLGVQNFSFGIYATNGTAMLWPIKLIP